jgi:Short C-terminal domain
VDLQEALRSAVRKVGLATPEVSGGVAEALGPRPDRLDQLKKLAELREADAITPAEYEEHKTKLLAKL